MPSAAQWAASPTVHQLATTHQEVPTQILSRLAAGLRAATTPEEVEQVSGPACHWSLTWSLSFGVCCAIFTMLAHGLSDPNLRSLARPIGHCC